MRLSSITSSRFIVLHKFGTTGRFSILEPDFTLCSLSGVCSNDSLGELDAIDIADVADEFDVCTCFCAVSFVSNTFGRISEVDRIGGVGDRVGVNVNPVSRFDDVVDVDKADACP